MNYKETLAFLFASLPMYQRDGQQAFKKSLDNILALCAALDNPQNKFKTLHVAGTNGKGSTAHMLSSVLQSAGYNTGLYTSPHLKSFTERIRTNGQEISEQSVVDFVARIKPLIEKIQPSFFEITVAMAFDFFALEKVEVAVVEVGLGGRLDSTNILTPELCIITNIGLDHQQMLGETLREIANEKAGIIKQDIPVVVGEKHLDTAPVFVGTADRLHAPLVFAEELVALEEGLEPDIIRVKVGAKQLQLKTDLKGKYQVKNIRTVVAAIDVLNQIGFSISEEAQATGLAHVARLTGLKGRWQLLRENPLEVCDTAHNAEGLAEVLKQIRSIPYAQLHVVWGMVNDKDAEKVLKFLPNDAIYYFCEPQIPRAMPIEELKRLGEQLNLKFETIKNVNAAIKKARKVAVAADMIYIGGSTFVVAEIENL